VKLFSVNCNQIANKISLVTDIFVSEREIYFSQYIVLKESQNFAHSLMTFKNSI